MLKRFLRNEQGSVFVIVAAGILVLVGAVGVAVDVGRGQMAQTKLQNALDAAGLAAGASINSADLEAEVTKYLNVNFTQGTQGAVVTNVDPVLSDDGTLLTVTADATMPTTFMRIFGHDTMELEAYTEVTRESKGMELAVVLDITGSMCQPCTKLDALKTAANDLLEILFGEGKTTAENLWIGIVPFSMGVNVGTGHTAWLDSAYYTGLDWGPTSWRGCTDARWSTGNDLTDATPTEEPFKAYYRADNNNYNNWITTGTSSDTVTTQLCGPTSASTCRCTSNGGSYVCSTVVNGNVSTRTYCSGSSPNRRCAKDVTTTTTTTNYSISSTRGPNRYCPTNAVTPLTNDRATLESAITALSADGGTHIPQGMAWGWRLISPKWRGFWGGSMDTNQLPLDYNTDLMIKAAILMTDGQNTMYSNADGAYGYLWENHLQINPVTDTNATAKLNTKLGNICTAMKAQGIIIYTVVFDLQDSTVDTMMENCASQKDYYFNTPDETALKQAFRTIGDSLANLRISK